MKLRWGIPKDMPLSIPTPAALRDRLGEMVVNDLFGPAGGPDEVLSH
jgi:hypothetical protein